MAGKRFLMAGGGTGGHVMPLLAVADQLRGRGHEPYFIGTRAGFEAKLVPQRGYRLEFIDIGGFQGVGLLRKSKLLFQLPIGIGQCGASIGRNRPAACFSLGGYVAAPPIVASIIRGVPIAVMEPNAVPGLVNRLAGRFTRKALLSFKEAAKFFPEGSVELTGLPVRDAFFNIEARPRSQSMTVLVTGGSQGSQSLNRAFRDAWPLLRDSTLPIRILHQCGLREEQSLRAGFASSGLTGEVTAFIDDMPAAFAQADLVVCRAGAGTVSELAAAGRPALLVPFPFAADDHQTKNAEAVVRTGAGLMLRDADLNGLKLFEVLSSLAADRDKLDTMAASARASRKPGAAVRAADILEEIALKQ